MEIFLKDLLKKAITIDVCIDVGPADGDFSELFIKYFMSRKNIFI